MIYLMEFVVNNQKIIIDDEDSWLLDFYKIFSLGQKNHIQCVSKKFPHKGSTRYYVHRLIIRALPHEEVDHINGNPLDNRRSNLRIVTRQQNCWNSNKPSHKEYSSKYKGVYFRNDCPNRPWIALFSCRGKKIKVGVFKTEIEAALAYNERIKQVRGEHAKLNRI